MKALSEFMREVPEKCRLEHYVSTMARMWIDAVISILVVEGDDVEA